MKYYAFIDTEDFVTIGDFDSIDEAFDNEFHGTMNTVWVFSEDSARAFLAKMKEELES